MTTLPPTPAPSSTDSDTEPHPAPSMMTRFDPELAALDATNAFGRFDTSRARRESVVVVTSGEDARSNVHVTVRTQPARGADPRKRASVVAIQVACFADDEEDEQATRIFDRHGNAVAWLSASQSPEPAATQRRGGEGEARAAQDTLRCPREDGAPAKRPKLPRSSVALLALGLLACAIGLSFGLGAPREPVVQRLPVQTIVGSVSAVAPRASERALAARPSASSSLVRHAPKPAQDAHADEQRPSARVTVDGLVLDVSATPWMEVQLDGRNVGTTPRKGLKVRRGVHDLVLVNRDLGLRTSVMLRAEPATRETQDISFE